MHNCTEIKRGLFSGMNKVIVEVTIQRELGERLAEDLDGAITKFLNQINEIANLAEEDD